MNGIRVGSIADIPIWVSPWYLLVLLLWSRGDVAQFMLLAVCVTVSLLVHEFGHASVAKRFKLAPQVLIHGFGGLCAHERAKRDRDDALIIAAGPGAGLLLAAASYALYAYGPPLGPRLSAALSLLIVINLFWSLFNLVPLWPLDGGQLYRLAMIKLLKPAAGERVTHITALVMVPVLFVAMQLLHFGGLFMLLILAMLAMQNLQALRAGGVGPVRRENPFAKELISQAEAAYREGDYVEAARLCHQARSEGNLPPGALDRCWSILGVCATHDEKYEEALSYLKRAPETAETVEATAQCLYALHMDTALAALTKSPGFRKLSRDKQQQIMEALAESSAEARADQAPSA